MLNTRETLDEPPPGGIFLSPELFIPEEITTLCEQLPLLLDLSLVANLKLNEIFPPDKPRLYCEYTNLVREKYISKAHVLGMLDLGKIEFIIKAIESIKSHASAYDDACSTIMTYAENVVNFLITSTEEAFLNINGRCYGTILAGAQAHRVFVRRDANNTVTYFNYYEDLTQPNCRVANINDYIQLIKDVKNECTQRGVVHAYPTYEPIYVSPEIIVETKRRIELNATYAYTYYVGLRFDDVISDNSGIITQVHKAGDQIVSEQQRRQADTCVTLSYFKPEGSQREYKWHLKTAKVNEGRQMETLTLTSKIMQAECLYYDAQGRYFRRDTIDAQELFSRIFELVECEETQGYIDKKRSKISKLRDSIGKYGIAAVMNPRGRSHSSTSSPSFVSPLELHT